MFIHVLNLIYLSSRFVDHLENHHVTSGPPNLWTGKKLDHFKIYLEVIEKKRSSFLNNLNSPFILKQL